MPISFTTEGTFKTCLKGAFSYLSAMANQALLIFIKNPEKGKVKTRLAAGVGEEQALRIYHALLNHTRRIAEQTPAERYLFYSSYIDTDDQWSPQKFYKKLQAPGDLGEKMARAFEATLKRHEKAVIIGSDCASLEATLIEQAFAALEEHDFVLGPALDGGYYLLGMKSFAPELFREIPWSTAGVRKITLGKIRQLGKTCHQLPPLSDIDHPEDWEKHGWTLD